MGTRWGGARQRGESRGLEAAVEGRPGRPGFLFRSGLMNVIIPMLPTRVGLVTRINLFVLRLTFIASRRRVVNPSSRV